MNMKSAKSVGVKSYRSCYYEVPWAGLFVATLLDGISLTRTMSAKSRVSRNLVCVLILGLLYCCTIRAQVQGFVTTSGDRLVLNGQTFRFGGPNIYWLGLDETVGGIPYNNGETSSSIISYPSSFRIQDALATAEEMGATVVRSHTLGISVGTPLSIEPSLNTFNDAAFKSIDFAIWQASSHGIRLIIPLVDNWHYYHGGKHNFTDWRGIGDENQFFTNGQVISDFEGYTSHILNHVNQYSGIALKNDPAILAWETGNEISPPSNWTAQVSAYIKSIDTNHLIVDGNYGVQQSSLSISTIDIVNGHFYGYAGEPAGPTNGSNLNSQVALAKGQKAFIAGEFDWNNTTGGTDLFGFLSAVQSNAGAAGALYWVLESHDDSFGYPQMSGFWLAWPEYDGTLASDAQALRSFAYNINGRTTPTYGTPNAPEITFVNGFKLVGIRGAVGASTYQLERSSSGASGPWSVITSGAVSDLSTPYNDANQPSGQVWYRAKAANLSGTYGPYSGVYLYSPNAMQAQLSDPLSNWDYVSGSTANLFFDGTNSGYFGGDTSRVARNVDDTESFYYVMNNASTFNFQVYTKASSSVLSNSLTIFASSDFATSFSPITYALSAGQYFGGGWTLYTATPSVQLPATTNAIKVQLSSGTGNFWDPQISSANFTYGSGVLSDPLSGWTNVAAHTTGLGLDSSNAPNFLSDTSRVTRTLDDTESFTYAIANLSRFDLLVWTKSTPSVLYSGALSVFVSSDGGTTYSSIPYTLGDESWGGVPGLQGWTGYYVSPTAALPQGTNMVKIQLSSGTGYAWDPQVGQAALTHTP